MSRPAVVPIPEPYTGDVRFDRARQLVSRFFRRDCRKTVYRDCYEDALGEALVALAAGESPYTAVVAFRDHEREYAMFNVTGGDVK